MGKGTVYVPSKTPAQPDVPPTAWAPTIRRDEVGDIYAMANEGRLAVGQRDGDRRAHLMASAGGEKVRTDTVGGGKGAREVRRSDHKALVYICVLKLRLNTLMHHLTAPVMKQCWLNDRPIGNLRQSNIAIYGIFAFTCAIFPPCKNL